MVPALSVSGQTVTLSGGSRAHSYAQAHAEDEVGANSQVFAYDHAFGPDTDQLSVFAACGAPLVKDLIAGFNATIFAYGQTGSGKTHTMIGSSLEPGLVPNATRFLFERLQALGGRDASKVHPDHAYTPRAAQRDGGESEDGDDSRATDPQREGHESDGRRTFKLSATYLQIYNESLIDLLSETTTPADLKIRTSAQLGIFVSGLTEHPVRSA